MISDRVVAGGGCRRAERAARTRLPNGETGVHVLPHERLEGGASRGRQGDMNATTWVSSS